MKSIILVLLFSTLVFSSSKIEVVYQLFGPVQHDGRELSNYSSSWGFIGDALSASTKGFPFSKGLPHVERAYWKMVWTPNTPSVQVRLIYADDGPSNITEIGRISHCGQVTPIATPTLDFTEVFNALVDSAVDKQIGFQIMDSLCCDYNAPTSIYESRLVVIYLIP